MCKIWKVASSTRLEFDSCEEDGVQDYVSSRSQSMARVGQGSKRKDHNPSPGQPLVQLRNRALERSDEVFRRIFRVGYLSRIDVTQTSCGYATSPTSNFGHEQHVLSPLFASTLQRYWCLLLPHSRLQIRRSRFCKALVSRVAQAGSGCRKDELNMASIWYIRTRWFNLMILIPIFQPS